MCIAKKKRTESVLKKKKPPPPPAAPVEAPKPTEPPVKSRLEPWIFPVNSDLSNRKVTFENLLDDPHNFDKKDNKYGEKLWNEKKAEKKKKIAEYEEVKDQPLKEKEEDRYTNIESLILDETQMSVIEELNWVDMKYRNAARPFWVMDEKHDKIALKWLQTMDGCVEAWKSDFKHILMSKKDPVTFKASNSNFELNWIGRSGGTDCQDKGRVVLMFPGLKSDYIHANYIGIPTNPKRFICTQTPMKSTIHAFWAMVIQEKVQQIVVKDDNRGKGMKYWAMLEGEKKEFGEGADAINVSHKTLHLRLDQINEYELKLKWGEGQERNVSVYQYNNYDHNTCHFLINMEFLPIIWNNKYPVVVHDSTGVDQSGSLIVAALIHEKMVDGDDCLNMVEIVKDFRKQRFQLLNTFVSFWSMYRTVRILLEDRCQYNPGFYPKFSKRIIEKRVVKD